MQVFIEAYGCALNRGEMSQAVDILRRAGHVIVPDEEGADAIVVHTCTVIETTQLRMERRIASYPPGARVIVTGCMAAITEQREALLSIRPDIILVRNDELETLPSTLATAVVEECDNETALTAMSQVSANGVRDRDRGDIPGTDAVVAVIPIADGCLGHCTYCITRLARGKLRSRNIGSIIHDIGTRVDAGVVEIRLAAPDTGCYGVDIGTDLIELMGRAVELEGEFRIRVGMMHPDRFISIHRRLAPLLVHPRMFSFIHVPIQSGSEDVLHRMGRPLDLERFHEAVEWLRGEVPDLTFWTDVIAGFPGETEHDHELSMDLVRRLGPDMVNVTRFSERKGTPAIGMDGRIIGSMRKARSRELSELRFSISRSNLTGWKGREVEVITTELQRDAVVGRTQGYRQVLIAGDIPLGVRMMVNVTDVRDTYLIGEPIC